MDVTKFQWQFRNLVGFYLLPHLILFRNPLELWNEKTQDSIHFSSISEALSYSVEGKTIRELIEKCERLEVPTLDGGRGASDGTQKTFKFSHADDRGSKDNTRSLPPAAANVRIQSKTLENAMKEFRQKHRDSDHEWAYEVDSQGFVHQYIEGNRSSVSIWGKSKNTMILHNHPSGGAFSDSDLISVSMQRHVKGVVAASKKAMYVFKKGSHFKADAFIKAVKRAEMKGTSYDDAVHKWLTKNQRKYGYKYKREK